jgi:hypothetical protein
MSRNTIIVLMYHRQKLLRLIYITNMYLVYIRSVGNLNELRFSWLSLFSRNARFMIFSPKALN